MAAYSLSLSLLMLVAYLAERLFGLRRWTSDVGDFSGCAFLEGRIYTAVTSSFLHNSMAHTLKQVLFLLLFGPAVEKTLGGLHFTVGYLFCGAGACILSWRMLRRRLLNDPNYMKENANAEDAANVAFIADSSPSRGGSACTYALATLSLVTCGEKQLRIGPSGEKNWTVATQIMLVGWRLIPDMFSRRRESRAWWLFALAVLLLGVAAVPRPPSVADLQICWFTVAIAAHYLEKATTSQRMMMTAAVTDWQSHLCGALLGALWGSVVAHRHMSETEVTLAMLSRIGLALGLAGFCGVQQ
eukprot:TRINITY_DN32192_c0_g1_i1.p1 TRINITY_DN32192_c0_g1~~TRINITY_DN32192_c0_g1_i1.p1  ORF type:complete len:312 (+),score=37.29 TRINITY_DN32192_c0_g1_i1:37-936(+)